MISHKRSHIGFTLAELLIAMLILGEISTFTIPKVLVAQQNAQNNAKAKEVASMLAGAYQRLQADGNASANTAPKDLIPYLNYVAQDTTTLLDNHPTASNVQCSPGTPCLKLHNGSMIWFDGGTFGGSTNLNVLEFRVDTTGKQDGFPAVGFEVYYNGFLTSRAYAKSGSCNSGGCGGIEPNSSYDPTWFKW